MGQDGKQVARTRRPETEAELADASRHAPSQWLALAPKLRTETVVGLALLALRADEMDIPAEDRRY